MRSPGRLLAAEELADPKIMRLIDDMRETLQDAPGVGLAAPQVGVPVQLAIVEDRPEYSKDIAADQLAERERLPIPFHVIINPVLEPISDRQVEFFEGCLSVNGFTALVARWREVRVRCLDESGHQRNIEATGWYARILQHEIDHLQGTLYIDRMRPRSFCTLENFTRHWKARSVAAVIDELK